MDVDVLIVGQGICGTMLSWFLHKEGKNFHVIDNNSNDASSKIAAGIINPVTGRRYVTTWMIEELIDFAKQSYSELGTYLNTAIIKNTSIIDFFPSAQMRNAFVERVEEDDTYLHAYPNQNYFNDDFNYDFGCGEISPVVMINMQLLLKGWREKLNELNKLSEEDFIEDEVQMKEGGIQYRGITAKKIIFCNGNKAQNSPWFKLLPFAPNKGEVLFIECPDLPTTHIFKRGTVLAPLFEKNIFWVGSSYQWEYEHEQPTESFYNHSNELLKDWLKKPFKILSHKASIRPATLERRPFVGFHPMYPQIGILNGMGTKGASLAPFFAHQLVQNIVYDFPLADEANVHRFSRILSR